MFILCLSNTHNHEAYHKTLTTVVLREMPISCYVWQALLQGNRFVYNAAQSDITHSVPRGATQYTQAWKLKALESMMWQPKTPQSMRSLTESTKTKTAESQPSSMW